MELEEFRVDVLCLWLPHLQIIWSVPNNFQNEYAVAIEKENSVH